MQNSEIELGSLNQRFAGVPVLLGSALKLSFCQTCLLALWLAAASLAMGGPLNLVPENDQESKPATALEFEVASVKPAKPPLTGGARGGGRLWNIKADPGTLMMTNVTLRILIHYAYGLQGEAEQDSQIVGGPSWINDDGYDVTAKSSGKLDKDQLFTMLQSLLVDRFRLRFHFEASEASVYALVVGKNGPKFHVAKPDKPPASPVDSVTMKQFTRFLAGSSLTNFIAPMDNTGLDATYDLSALTAAPDPSMPLVDQWISRMPESLGLELKKQKAQVRKFVIEHAEKPLSN